MKIIHISQKPRGVSPCAVAIGAFDGIHLGHQQLLGKTVGEAKKRGLVPAVFTILPARDFKNVEQILPTEEKYRRMEALGIEVVFEADYSAIRSLSPDVFVRDILIGTCAAEIALCGFNFRFGKGAAADGGDLISLMRESGKDALCISAVTVDGAPASATRIRGAIGQGNMPLAAELLGTPFTLFGTVEHGARLGHTLNIPTVNLPIPSAFLVPRQGVYISRTQIGKDIFPSVTNIGVRPTVASDAPVNCETHVLASLGETYGQAIKVELLSYLREERQFPDLEALRAGIRSDIERTRLFFDGARAD